jgi:hypothetical protein
MANEQILLRAKARKLGIDGYRKMSLDELKRAIKSAEGKTGKSSKTAAKTASTNGRKTATKTTGKKSAGRAKSAPAKSAKTGAKAKRRATGAKSSSTRKASVPNRKPTASKSMQNGSVLRADIDNSSVDWTADWNGGKTGNRGEIMKLLRKHKGNVEKVFDKLADKAKTMYPKTNDGRARSKADAQTLLRWHISRIKYDFVKATDQHESADNPNYRKAAKGNQRGGRAVKSAKSTGGRKSAASGKSARKPARKPATRQKATQGRAKASSKSSAKRTGGRKTAASRKRR